MKARDAGRLEAIRFLSAAIKQREIELRESGKQVLEHSLGFLGRGFFLWGLVGFNPHGVRQHRGAGSTFSGQRVWHMPAAAQCIVPERQQQVRWVTPLWSRRQHSLQANWCGGVGWGVQGCTYKQHVVRLGAEAGMGVGRSEGVGVGWDKGEAGGVVVQVHNVGGGKGRGQCGPLGIVECRWAAPLLNHTACAAVGV